eukprot:Sro583_g170650.1 n/a (552) ;mRNA; r:24409-26064
MAPSPAEEKLGSPSRSPIRQQGYPLRGSLTNSTTGLMGVSATHDAQQRMAASAAADYQSSLLASSLANRHAELAQRQLLSRYFNSPQMRLNSLATSLAAPPAFGLASLAGHQLPGAAATNPSAAVAAAAAAGQGGNSQASLAALLSLPQADTLQSMTARFHHQQQQANPVLGPTGDAFQGCLPVSGSSRNSSHHSAERLQGVAINAGPGLGSAGMSSFRSQPSMLPNVPQAVAAVNNSAVVGVDESGAPIALGIDEDPNWLSDFHVFVRKNLVELCWASSEDVALRNASNRVSSHQVGIRCRCCAHLNPSARAQRSSAFPSSIAQIYQSFTMMLRAHFSSCTEVPPALKEKFLALKSKTTQGATDSKQYWIYSARKLGMVDSEDGIVMTPATTTAARALPPFGTNPATGRGGEESSPLPLVAPNDRSVASDFLYTLMLQARRVRLQANEQRGNKKSLQLGLPGFACRHCCSLGRMGQCRIFPARRRTLPTKIYDLYEHLVRCTACPQETKELLEVLHGRENYQPKTPGHKEFLDLIWSRLVEQQQQAQQQS